MPKLGVRRDVLLVRGRFQDRDHVRRNGARKKRVIQKRRGRGIGEHRRFTSKGWRHLPCAVLLHQGDQLVIHGTVADAVGNAIQAGGRELLRILEVEDVRHHFQTVPVRCLDDGRRNGDGNLRQLAGIVIDANLYQGLDGAWPTRRLPSWRPRASRPRKGRLPCRRSEWDIRSCP